MRDGPHGHLVCWQYRDKCAAVMHSKSDTFHARRHLYYLATCPYLHLATDWGWSGSERKTESVLASVWSITPSQRKVATVGSMNYEMIRGCKMEIDPGDYTAQYLTIWFFCQWFFIAVVWRTARLIIPHVWSMAGESIVVMEFFWMWLRRQLHFASHFQDFFLDGFSFSSSFCDGRKIRPHQTVFVFFFHPLGCQRCGKPKR